MVTLFTLDRVIYARKEGEASSGSVLEAGEKITLEQASVSNKCIHYQNIISLLCIEIFAIIFHKSK